MFKFLRRLIGAIIVLAVIIVAGGFAWVRVVSHDRVYEATEAPYRDVALVLGAGLTPDGTPSTYLSGRLDEAVTLYNAGLVSVILVSGDNRTTSYSEPDAMAGYLVEKGIPREDVIADYAGLDTYDSCYRARDIFGVTSVTVIGQSYHIARAVTTCQMLGLDTVGVGNEQPHATSTWRWGIVRELGSNVKLIADLIQRREATIMGSQETSVTDALARHGR